MKWLTQIAAVFWMLSSVVWDVHERFVHWPSVLGREWFAFGFTVVMAAVVGLIVHQGIRSGLNWVWWFTLTGLIFPLVIPTVVGVALLDRRWWAWWIVILATFGSGVFIALNGNRYFITPPFSFLTYFVPGLLLIDAILSWRVQRQWFSTRTFLLDPLCRDRELYGTRTATN